MSGRLSHFVYFDVYFSECFEFVREYILYAAPF